MNLFELSEEEKDSVKKTLLENEIVFEKKKIKQYESKYFELVTISNILIKFFLFFSLGVYVVINLVGVVLSILYSSNITNPFMDIVGLCIICFIISAIFMNVNTNKKKEDSIIYVNDNHFIFNFCDGVVETPTLYYMLPYDSIQKIEFIIHSVRKKQIFGSVTFTFTVLGYEVTHTIRYTNLTGIEELLKDKFPSLLPNLFQDGKNKTHTEKIKDKKKIRCICGSFAIFALSIGVILVPYFLKYHCVACIIASVILMITASVVFLSPFLYTYHLVQGSIVSGIFILIGICVPCFLIESSQMSFLEYVIQNNSALLITIFGIVGVCLYAYILPIIVGKAVFMLKRK
ncbi:MAG: hypothetical protein K2F56_00730 [Anaeroplasmataceae bacterium]|nr:hypothetical protein [Anaeroplasmataceae bacterium]